MGVIDRVAGHFPDFIILGAQKAGTTSLYDNLVQHPRVISAYRKEVHFFDNQSSKGVDWYRQQFPKYRRARPWIVTGEATPYYLFHPQVPDRIRATSPKAKFIILLRDPVSRAYSHYQTMKRRERETLPFDEAIRIEPERMEGETEKLVDPDYQSVAHQHLSYVSRGIYADQIEAWSERFPREQFLIMSSDELFSDPQGSTDRTFAFLGLKPIKLTEYAHRNLGGYKEKMSSEAERYLRDFYRPHNERLFRLIGRDYGWNDK